MACRRFSLSRRKRGGKKSYLSFREPTQDTSYPHTMTPTKKAAAPRFRTQEQKQKAANRRRDTRFQQLAEEKYAKKHKSLLNRRDRIRNGGQQLKHNEISDLDYEIENQKKNRKEIIEQYKTSMSSTTTNNNNDINQEATPIPPPVEPPVDYRLVPMPQSMGTDPTRTTRAAMRRQREHELAMATLASLDNDSKIIAEGMKTKKEIYLDQMKKEEEYNASLDAGLH